jgi:hypothetical protein
MLLLLPGAGPAWGSEASTIIERCAHHQTLSGFSEKGYREALRHMPTVASEYSDCPTLIRNAELAASAGRAGAGAGELGAAASSNAPLPLTPAERREVLGAHRRIAPVLLGKSVVRPGVVHADIASATSVLPSSLLSVLGALIVAGLLLAMGKALERVRARRPR